MTPADGRPLPIQATVIYVEAEEGTISVITRRWTLADASACRRCTRCIAQVGPDGQAICQHAVRWDVHEDVVADFVPPPCARPQLDRMYWCPAPEGQERAYLVGTNPLDADRSALIDPDLN